VTTTHETAPNRPSTSRVGDLPRNSNSRLTLRPRLICKHLQSGRAAKPTTRQHRTCYDSTWSADKIGRKLPHEGFETGLNPQHLEHSSEKNAMSVLEALSPIIGDAKQGDEQDMDAAIFRQEEDDEGEMGALEHPSDPDAQATVTDYLDFTEYLPSDIIRSLTLIGKLDQVCNVAQRNAHELSKTYGNRPVVEDHARPEPVAMREDIAESINEALHNRTLSHAEACRMAENVERHYLRAKTILAKLRALADSYPTTTDVTSPAHVAPSSPQAVRAPKITLRLDGSRPSAGSSGARVPRPRAPRIIVPGDVLAPYEFDYDTVETDTDGWDSVDDEPMTPPRTGGVGRIKLVNRPKSSSKIRLPKSMRTPRPPGSMGTNVHSAVAGISTSNALRECTPPPPDVVPGDKKHAPWLELTRYELAKLRKRMKKNAVWSPSDTMIMRELKLLGRGIDGYRAAKARAEAAGEPFEYEISAPVYDASGNKVVAEGAVSLDAVSRADLNEENRGMKLNQAKKLKRESQAKELAKIAAEEAEQSARKISDAATAISLLFAQPDTRSSGGDASRVSETPSRTRALPRKRKRGSTADTDGAKLENDESRAAISSKRLKTETPVPAPITTASSQLSNMSGLSIPPTPADLPGGQGQASGSTTATSLPPLPASPKKQTTTILPPAKDNKREPRKASAAPPQTRQQRSAAATPAPSSEPVTAATARRPASRASSRPASRGKAASVEPAPSTAGRDRSQRASTVHNTPAPEAQPPRPSSRRAKRPAPGPVQGGATGGSTAVSVGKRTAAPRKKAGPKKQPKEEDKAAEEIWDEVDDEGNVIDPDEPRYCLCNRVSFGIMICCENSDVSLSSPMMCGSRSNRA
jgi:hypothetical protein